MFLLFSPAASAVVVARELGMVEHAEQTLLRFVSRDVLSRIEQAIDATQPLEPAQPTGA